MGDQLDAGMLAKMQILLSRVVAAGEAESPEAPDPGSPLDVLDQRLDHPYLISHLYASSVAVAHDHLVTIQRLIFAAQTVTTWGSMTLVRAALENAATALWLLSDSDPDERCTRALQLAATDLSDERQFIEHMAGVVDEDDVGRALRAEVQRLHKTRHDLKRRARHLGLDPVRVGNTLRLSTILNTVAQEIGHHDGFLLLHWKLMSGLTHGRRYASLKGLDREIVAHDGRSATAKFTVNEDQLYVGVGMAAHLLDLAMQRYAADRRNPGRGAAFFRPGKA